MASDSIAILFLRPPGAKWTCHRETSSLHRPKGANFFSSPRSHDKTYILYVDCRDSDDTVIHGQSYAIVCSLNNRIGLRYFFVWLLYRRKRPKKKKHSRIEIGLKVLQPLCIHQVIHEHLIWLPLVPWKELQARENLIIFQTLSVYADSSGSAYNKFDDGWNTSRALSLVKKMDARLWHLSMSRGQTEG